MNPIVNIIFLLLSLILFSSCTAARFHVSKFASPTKRGYVMGHVHISSKLMKPNKSSLHVILSNTKTGKEEKVYCPIYRKTNFMCYFLISLRKGSYALKKVAFERADFLKSGVSDVKFGTRFEILPNQITYIEGYTLQPKPGGSKKLRFIKSDNLMNTLEYFRRLHKIDIAAKMAIAYHSKDTRVIPSFQQRVRPFNFSGKLSVQGVRGKQLFVTLQSHNDKKTMLYIPQKNRLFYSYLPPETYRVKNFYSPHSNMMWEYPEEQTLEIKKQQAVYLGSDYFAFDRLSTMTFNREFPDIDIETVINQRSIVSPWLTLPEESFAVTLPSPKPGSLCGFFTVNKPKMKKLVLEVKNLNTKKKVKMILDYFLQPYCFKLPPGNYQFQSVRVIDSKNEWNLAADRRNRKSYFSVRKDGVTFAGNLKFSVISRQVLSYDVLKDQKELKKIQSLASSRSRVYY